MKDNPSYHPGRCAAFYAGGRCLGVFGQIHPLVAKNYGVSDELYAAEIDFAAMFESRTTEIYYAPLPRFPAVMRDISVVCDDAVTAGELSKCIKRAGGEYLESVEVFDVYKGANIPRARRAFPSRWPSAPTSRRSPTATPRRPSPPSSPRWKRSTAP